MPDVDNGPKVVPAPPGPTPTGPYEYLTVPLQPPVAPNSPFYMAFTAYQQVETEVYIRGAMADRLTLFDGRRVYRVLLQYMWRFDHDLLGCFIGRHPKPSFRFEVNDPTIGIASYDMWAPI